MAILLKADGSRIEGITGIGPEGRFTLKQLQEAVGGYIEGVPGTHNRAWCNEEGLLEGLLLNEAASFLFGLQLVGDVLMMDEDDKYEGDEEDE